MYRSFCSRYFGLGILKDQASIGYRSRHFASILTIIIAAANVVQALSLLEKSSPPNAYILPPKGEGHRE